MKRHRTITRREMLKISGTAMVGSLLAACGTAPAVTEQTSSSTTASAAPTASPSATASTVATSGATTTAEAGVSSALLPGSPDHARGWTTNLPSIPEGMPLNPAVTIRVNTHVDAATKHLGGDSNINNPFTRMTQELMGINWEEAWAANQGEELQQRWQLAIASNDLPDVMDWVAPDLFRQMAEADMLEDITDVWERVADPELLKRALDAENGLAWNYVTVNGRRMGVPIIEAAAQNDKLLWVRQDWLDKVGMEPPTTLEDLARVARAFVDAKLGGETTIGLNAGNELNTWVSSLDPIFGAFGILPSAFGGDITSTWIENNGQLVYGSIQPQMRDALALLRQWYVDGVLRQDFFTIAPADSVQAISGNQAGMVFAPSWMAGWGVADSIKNDPSARWIFTDVPTGPDGRKGKTWSNPYREVSYLFRKGSPHVESTIRYWNWIAALAQPAAQMHGWEGYQYQWNGDALEDTELGTQQWFYYAPLFNGRSDTRRIFDENAQQEEWSTLPADRLDAWQARVVEDPTGTAALNREAYAFAFERTNEDGIRNQFTTLATPTMTTAGSTLITLETQTLLAIISGEQPLEAFDTFVEQWRSSGGDAITDEVNTWYQSRASS